MKCKFCYVSFYNEKLNDFSIEIIRHAYCLGFDVITFSGGDPFSKVKFRDACKEAKRLGIKTHVDTNSLAVKRGDLSFIEENIDILGVSLDGVESTHDNLRESKNSFKKSELLIQAVDETSTIIKINTIITKENINCLTELSHFIDKYPKISIWSIYQFFPLDAAYKHEEKYSITNEEFEYYTKRLQVNSRVKVEIFPYKNRVDGYLFVNELGELFTNSIDGNYIQMGSFFNTKLKDLEFNKFINPRTQHRYE
jgi:MoaA/NifB/PqqE/SkfB family radical SAM enzyme